MRSRGINDDVTCRLDRVSKGIRDPEAVPLARERMDKDREETHRRIGTVDVIVPTLRELRN